MKPFKALQKCFEARDIPLLQKTISELPEDEAKYHLKRCVDSGLWVPDASKAKETETTESDSIDGDGDGAGASSSNDSKPNISTEDVD